MNRNLDIIMDKNMNINLDMINNHELKHEHKS